MRLDECNYQRLDEVEEMEDQRRWLHSIQALQVVVQRLQTAERLCVWTHVVA